MKTALLYITSEASWKLAGLNLLERAVLPHRRQGYKRFLVVNRGGDLTALRKSMARLQRRGITFQLLGEEPVVVNANLLAYDLVLRTDELIVKEERLPIHSRQELKQAKRCLYNSLYRSLRKPTEGFILRYVNRKLSRWLTSLLVWTPLTPNQISFSVGIMGIVSGWLISRGVYVDVALGGILFQLSSIIDCTDGEVAKLKYSWSKKGQWIDTICDNLSYFAFLIGALFGVVNQGTFAHPGLLAVIMFGGVITTLGVMFYYLIRHTDSGSLVTVAKELVHDLEGETQYWPIRLLMKIKFVMKRDFFAFFFMFLCLINQLEWILVLTALGANFTWIVLVTVKREFATQKAPLLQEE